MKASNRSIGVFKIRPVAIAAALIVAVLLAGFPALAQDPFTGNPVAKIAKELSSAVVNIDVETMVRRSVHPFADDPFFKQFFGEEFKRFSRAVPMKGRGSGFIVSKEGRIITNNHVVDGADKISVTMCDGEVYEARILGKDPTFDLAVLKIEGNGKDFPVIELGDSDRTEVGEWVVAIGNPLGLEHSVTVGVISAKNRSIHAGRVNFDGFLQTDAAINPGNSGGPLIDLSGKVVGINTAIVPYAQGIGFAIPVNMAKQVMDDLIQYGTVKRGWLGVYIQALTKEFADAYGIKEDHGAVISDVMADSPAEKAGLKRGDVVLTVNGEKVKDHQQLVNKIRQRMSGEKVSLSIVRQGKAVALSVTLGEIPGNDGDVIGSAGGKMLKSLGIEAVSVTEEIQKKLGLKSSEGLSVSSVEEGSIAARGGIREGDILLEINGIRLKSLSDLEKAASSGRSSTVILVWREGRTFFVSVRGGK
ncbi:MAG: Do family serine endopeptidase [Synergistaceae bacterium]|nr:Do family serine endopeptidase [Synergistaceae bacterium]